MTIHKIMLCFSLNFRAFFNPKLSGGFSRKQLTRMDLETTFFLFTKHTKMELYHLTVVIHANSICGCSEMVSGDSYTRKKIRLLLSHQEQ